MPKTISLYSSLYVTHLFILFNSAHGSILDYFPLGKSLFGSDSETEQFNELSMQKVPYEVEVTDEKFIEQAAKFTGVSLSDLDKCQHRVVFKLRSECHKLNDEELAKLAVKLLNCQSAIEGRTVYPCTDEMPIRDCTSKMDPDTWNSYLLMSNRARAVCYSIRQAQFRGLTEMTVNKLMGAAHEQLSLMTRLSSSQARTEEATAEAFDQVKTDTKILRQQQQDLQQAQFFGQLALEDNIRRLADEKQLIIEGHEQLATMTKEVQAKLDEAAKQIDKQANERKNNHEEILRDLIEIQKQAQQIFARIEQSSRDLLNTQSTFTSHYKSTLHHLFEINSTIAQLGRQVQYLGSTFDQHLSWLTETLGGTDDALERLTTAAQHAMFLLLGMVACAFLKVGITGRIGLLVLVPGNLYLQVWGLQHLGMVDLVGTTVGFIISQSVLNYFLKYHSLRQSPNYIQNAETYCEKINSDSNKVLDSEELSHDTYDSPSRDSTFSDSFTNHSGADTTTFNSRYNTYKRFDLDSIDDQVVNGDLDFASPTPPLSRQGRSRSKTPSMSGMNRCKCSATTRMGTPCKSMALLGRDFCYRHQKGSSVIVE